MGYPTKPTIGYDYEEFEEGLGTGNFPGGEIDADLANLQASVSAIIDFIKAFAKSDGTLANQSVGAEQLKASVLVGLDTPSIWEAATPYTTSSLVFVGARLYLAAEAHTSSNLFSMDLSAGRWTEILDLTPTGALIAASNLSDLASAITARTNLGLGSLATEDTGTGAAEFRTNIQNEVTFLRQAFNLSDLGNAATARLNLGLGSMAEANAALYGTTTVNDGRYARRANNLSDLANAGTARSNLGLGALATLNSGTAAGEVRTNAQAEDAYIPNGAWPGVYTGSDANNVTFPIGTTRMVDSDSVARNATATVRLSTVDTAKYTTAGTGAALTGTWKAAGDTRFNDHGQLFVRVA